MVKVFSVTVSPNSDATSQICGKIEVHDHKSYGGGGNPFVMFNRNELSPVTLNADMKIKPSSLKSPVSTFEGPCFFVYLHLSDDEGHEVSHGVINWDVDSAHDGVSWWGKLVSSVILGKHGYATVNYAMFRNAVNAEVRVMFRPNHITEYEYMLVGGITAWYSSIKYPTCMEKKLFRSTLLNGGHAVLVISGRALHLDRKSVAVPLGSSLILGMKFEVGVVGRTQEGPWFWKHYGSMNEEVDIEMDIGEGRSEKTVEGDGFSMHVVVKWIQADRDEKMKIYGCLGRELERRFLEA